MRSGICTSSPRMNSTTTRILVFSIGCVGAFFVHWTVPLIAIAILALAYRSWEALILALLVDLLWWTPVGEWSLAMLPLYTIGAICAVWMFEPLRLEFFR